MRALGESGHIPAPLWFSQSTEDQIDDLMILDQRIITAILAQGTLALMNGCWCFRDHWLAFSAQVDIVYHAWVKLFFYEPLASRNCVPQVMKYTTREQRSYNQG